MALCQSANAHCTIIQQQLEHEKTHLENPNKKWTHGSTKIKAHTIIAPELERIFEEEERQAREKEVVERERDQLKAVESVDQNQCIVKAAECRVLISHSVHID